MVLALALRRLQSPEDMKICFHVDSGWREATVLEVTIRGLTRCEWLKREQDGCHRVFNDLALEVKFLSFVQYPVGSKNWIYLVCKGLT